MLWDGAKTVIELLDYKISKTYTTEYEYAFSGSLLL